MTQALIQMSFWKWLHYSAQSTNAILISDGAILHYLIYGFFKSVEKKICSVRSVSALYSQCSPSPTSLASDDFKLYFCLVCTLKWPQTLGIFDYSAKEVPNDWVTECVCDKCVRRNHGSGYTWIFLWPPIFVVNFAELDDFFFFLGQSTTWKRKYSNWSESNPIMGKIVSELL